MGRRNDTAWIFPASVVGALVVGVIWTAITGSLVQWLPILGAIWVALAASKAMNKKGRR